MHLERIYPKMDVTRAYPHGCTAYCPPSVHYHSDNVRGCCIPEVHRKLRNVMLQPGTFRLVGPDIGKLLTARIGIERKLRKFP
jgi:hypothetical protein